MKVLGITGGMGSGKSTIAKFFEEWGVPVYEADLQARILSDSDPEIVRKVSALLGEESYGPQGMDRAYVASRVFNDQSLLKALNRIIHPVVGQHFESWLAAQTAPYCLKEAAILFETGGHAACDWTLLITAPVEVRIARIMDRDNLSRPDILARLDKQWPDDRKLALADFHIENIDLELARSEARQIHQQISSGI